MKEISISDTLDVFFICNMVSTIIDEDIFWKINHEIEGQIWDKTTLFISKDMLK